MFLMFLNMYVEKKMIAINTAQTGLVYKSVQFCSFQDYKDIYKNLQMQVYKYRNKWCTTAISIQDVYIIVAVASYYLDGSNHINRVNAN